MRNPGELEKIGRIEGAINIPVDELRSQLHSLPKDKDRITSYNVCYTKLLRIGNC